MRRIILAVLITCFAVGTAAAQSCDSKVVLCQEGVRAPCCMRDEGRPFGAAL